MKNRNTLLITTFIFGVILITEIIFEQFFPEITFINGHLITANRILGYFAFSFLIFSLITIFKVSKSIVKFFGALLLIVFLINSCSEIYPIDTTTKPVDVLILKTNPSGNKLIIREYKNIKTNQIIQDTVLVKDYFIFRQIISQNK